MTYKITVDDLVQDIELAKQIAIKNNNANSLVAAVMAQAKLLGLLDNDNKVTGNPQPIAVNIQVQDARKRDEV